MSNTGWLHCCFSIFQKLPLTFPSHFSLQDKMNLYLNPANASGSHCLWAAIINKASNLIAIFQAKGRFYGRGSQFNYAWPFECWQETSVVTAVVHFQESYNLPCGIFSRFLTLLNSTTQCTGTLWNQFHKTG